MQRHLLSIEYFELYTQISSLVQRTILHYNPFKYFFLASTKNYGMLVAAYDSTLCKNPVMFFEKNEWINLIFILAQLAGLYSNHIFSCSFIHDSFFYL